MEVCSIFDKVAEAYLRPLFTRSVAEAVRLFKDECEGDTIMAKHASDYELYHVGVFDERSGVVKGFDPPQLVMKGVHVVNSKPEVEK